MAGVAIVLAAGTFVALVVSPGGRLSLGGGPPPPSTGGITVDLGGPILATATCADGETTSMEAVPWLSASPALSTAVIYLEVVELVDGDIDGGPTPYPTVTTDSLCGAPLATPWVSWYAVLQDPAGANVAFYSYSQGWVDLGHSAQPTPIANGSALVLVSDPSFASRSFGFCVVGGPGATALRVCTPL